MRLLEVGEPALRILHDVRRCTARVVPDAGAEYDVVPRGVGRVGLTGRHDRIDEGPPLDGLLVVPELHADGTGRRRTAVRRRSRLVGGARFAGAERLLAAGP
ncbi:hypothetical protein [Streptomyces sp. NPDC093225]|uniref:hypothetical protein n=1 Tax=Streptomyces sp. NPDC093225 TaxID=3366034 RepID=UPI003804D29A